MPSDFNEIEKLAFIENEIAKQISFDEQYLWGDRETKEKIYKLAKTEAQRPHKEIKRKLICITMSELFGYIAKELGFEVMYQKCAPGVEDKTGQRDIFNKVSSKKQEHVYPIVKLSNGKYIKIDIQFDLYRLKTHSKPKAFGSNQIIIQNGIKTLILDNSEIEKIFRKIYQLDENERFTDEYIMVFAAMLRCQHKTPIEMLEFFMNDPKIQEALQNARCIEANKLYKKILGVCYDESRENQFFKEKDKAIIEECVLYGEEQKRYSFCIYAENEEQRQFYVYSKRSRRMVNLTQEQVKQITQQAKNIELRGRSSELKEQMKAFIKGNGENIQILGQEENTISLDDIFLDEDR